MFRKVKNVFVLLIALLLLPNVLNAEVKFGSNLPETVYIKGVGHAEPFYAYLTNWNKQDSGWVYSEHLATLEGRNATCDENKKRYVYCPYVNGKREGLCDYFFEAEAPRNNGTLTWKKGEEYLIWCTYDVADKSSKKEITQAMYSADGRDAYCVMPGRAFENQTYKKAREWDVSKCKNSNQSYHCGLAATAMLVEQNYGGDYLTMLTALRFLTAKYGGGSGWWDSVTKNTYSNANMYVTTQQDVLSGKYNGGGSNDIGNVRWLFADTASSLSALQNAISTFRSIVSGVKMWTPNIKVQSPIRRYDEIIINIQTNFDNTVKIKSIVGEKLGDLMQYVTTGSCEGSEGICIILTLPKDILQNSTDEEICDNIKVIYDYPEDIITKVALYRATKNGSYQEMVVFDKGAEAYFTTPLCIGNPICQYYEGEWYDRDGNITDRQGYQESCLCVEVDGVKYVEYPEPATDEEFDAFCNSHCDNTEIDTEDMVADCEKDGSEGEIKDPAICGVIDRRDGNYRKDEYKNEYCDVFCRETVRFTFMPKPDESDRVSAGRFFYHDVKAKYITIERLSTVILSTRQCASTIKYDEWKKNYEAANSAVLSTWNTLKYWEGFYNLASGTHTDEKEGGGASGCNDCNHDPIDDYTLIWQYGSYCTTFSNELTSCTSQAVYSATGVSGLCPQSKCHGCSTAGGYDNCCYTTCEGTSRAPYQNKYNVVRDAYNDALKAYKGALDERDRLLYALQDCNFMAKKDSEASGNTLYQTYSKPAEGYDTSLHGGKYVTKATLNTYDRVMEYSPQNKFHIEYEENELSSSGKGFYEGFPIDTESREEDDSPNMVDVMNFSDSGEWDNYCNGDCYGDLSNLQPITFTEQLDYWSCVGSSTGTCSKIQITVPKNKVTSILIDHESASYQRAKLATQVYTGIVNVEGSSNGFWIPMDLHVYPVGVNRLTGRYDINVIWESIGDQNKVVTFEPGEFACKYLVKNDLNRYDCDDSVPGHICYCDPRYQDCCDPTKENCDGPGNNAIDLGVYFRTIDLADVFPNSKYSIYYNGNVSESRPIGSNWNTQNAFQVVQEIQKLEQNNTNGFLTQKPQYQITLSPGIRKEIRKYNSYTNYLDYSLNCTSLECISDFLRNELKEIMGVKYKDLYNKNGFVDINKKNLYNYTAPVR